MWSWTRLGTQVVLPQGIPTITYLYICLIARHARNHTRDNFTMSRIHTLPSHFL